MWEIYTMSELWDLCNPIPNKTFIKPEFPTRRWGEITTHTSSTDKLAIEKGIVLLKEKGVKCRKRIDHFNTKKFKSYGKKFYQIEYKKTD